MVEEIEPIKMLKSARDKLVEERRALSVAMALGYRRRRTDDVHANDMREAFIGIQNTIEAIDRAIAHEKLIATGKPESLVVPRLETDPSSAPQFDNRH